MSVTVFSIEYVWQVDELTLDSEILITFDRLPTLEDKPRIMEIIKDKVDMHDYELLYLDLDELLMEGSSANFLIVPITVHKL